MEYRDSGSELVTRGTIEEALENLFGHAKKLALPISQETAADEALVKDQVIDLWSAFSRMRTLAWVGQGAVIHVLNADTAHQNPDTGRPYKMWERIQIAQDAQGVFVPPSATWASFCWTHLGISPSEASNLKRNYEVFYQEWGLAIPELLAAGDSRLNVARAYLEAHPDDKEIKTAVFGAREICANCGFVLAPGTSVPLICAECGEPFLSRKPLPVRKVRDMVGDRRMANDPMRVWSLQGHLEHVPGDDEVVVYVDLALSNSKRKREVDAWIIDVAGWDEEEIKSLLRLLGVMFR